jgi:hypothetical protein
MGEMDDEDDIDDEEEEEDEDDEEEDREDGEFFESASSSSCCCPPFELVMDEALVVGFGGGELPLLDALLVDDDVSPLMAELDVVVIEGDSLLLLPLGFAPPVAALL